MEGVSGPAFFSFWIDRFLAATATWDDAEVGAYLRLLLHQYQHGRIPADPARIQRLVSTRGAAFVSMWEAVLADKFPPVDGGRANGRASQERDIAMSMSGLQSHRAKKGWETRKNAGAMPRQSSGNAAAMPGHSSGIAQPQSGHMPDGQLGKATQTHTHTQTETHTQTHEGASHPTRARAREAFDPKVFALESFPVQAPELLPTIDRWQEYRRSIGKPWKAPTWKAQLKVAAKDPAAWAASVEQSVRQGWHGLFDVRAAESTQNRPTGVDAARAFLGRLQTKATQ